MVGAKFLVQASFVLVARPGYSAPVTSNKTMLLSVLNLFCFYMNGLLKVRALRMGFLYISGYRQ